MTIDTPMDGPKDPLRRARSFGWWSLLAWLSLGIVLEGMHAFKLRWYLDVVNDARRHMFNLRTVASAPEFDGTVKRALMSNWRLAVIYRWLSGAPLTIQAGADFPGVDQDSDGGAGAKEWR